MTGMSTPPTPSNNDFNADISKMPGLASHDFFSGFDVSNSSTAFDLLGTSTDPTKMAFPTINEKAAANQIGGTTLYDNFSFDTGGTFNGNNTDLDNMFDLLSPKTEVARQMNKRLVTVDVNKLIEGKLVCV
jgi:hypothetical protein